MTGRQYYQQITSTRRKKKPWELLSPEIKAMYEKLAQSKPKTNGFKGAQ